MSEFETKPVELPMDAPDTGSRLKNIKEFKFANSVFTIDPTGKTEIRDANGVVVILIDPNG